MSSPLSAPRRGLRIVVTDDDPKLLTAIVQILSDAGHNVFAAYDGLSACELAEYIPNLDLVISNTRMKTLKAPELIQRVRNACELALQADSITMEESAHLLKTFSESLEGYTYLERD